uniref:Uncharacterized protein n=1 Tax=Rhizophora mucronata TaxID=61149 RepID=A0A2P2R206_RHIMU
MISQVLQNFLIYVQWMCQICCRHFV